MRTWVPQLQRGPRYHTRSEDLGTLAATPQRSKLVTIERASQCRTERGKCGGEENAFSGNITWTLEERGLGRTKRGDPFFSPFCLKKQLFHCIMFITA